MFSQNKVCYYSLNVVMVMTSLGCHGDDVTPPAGYTVRVVGGAVRDVLQDKPPKDIDMTTNATPDQIVAICVDNGIKHILTGRLSRVVTSSVSPHCDVTNVY